MATRKAWLVCSEGAVFPVEGSAPTGIYGCDWIVVRAASWRAALQIGTRIIDASWRCVPLDVQDAELSLDEAMAEFGAQS